MSLDRFSSVHQFEKPNDVAALNLMNRAAHTVMEEFPDVVFAIGESDEYSFVLRRDCTLFQRRQSKISSCIVSLFASSYVHFWSMYFPETTLKYPPCFDSRVVCYPNLNVLRDYISWRQVDCHINNLYNTCFWNLVLTGGMTEVEAEQFLAGTKSDEKNELLFSKFDINYAKLPEMFRKGSVLYRGSVDEPVRNSRTGEMTIRKRRKLLCTHQDVIGDQFWTDHPKLLK